MNHFYKACLVLQESCHVRKKLNVIWQSQQSSKHRNKVLRHLLLTFKQNAHFQYSCTFRDASTFKNQGSTWRKLTITDNCNSTPNAWTKEYRTWKVCPNCSVKLLFNSSTCFNSITQLLTSKRAFLSPKYSSSYCFPGNVEELDRAISDYWNPISI